MCFPGGLASRHSVLGAAGRGEGGGGGGILSHHQLHF